MRIGYARVSTRGQTDESQLQALHAAGCEKVFRETMTGARADRPELAACLETLRSGDVLVVTRLSRLGRSLRHLVAFASQLDDRRVELVSLRESIDTTTPAGRLTFNLFASLAEFERDLIRETVAAGLDAAAANGRRGGRPARLSEEQISHALDMDARGRPLAEVARVLHVSRSTLYRALQGRRTA